MSAWAFTATTAPQSAKGLRFVPMVYQRDSQRARRLGSALQYRHHTHPTRGADRQQAAAAAAFLGDLTDDILLEQLLEFGEGTHAVIEALDEHQHEESHHQDVAKLAYELFPDMPQGFSGECEIRAQVPVVPITLKLTTNKRNDFLLTTLPVADLTQAPPQGIVVFPQIAFGAEYSTRLILIGADPQKNVTGSLRLYQSSGAPLNVPLAGQTGDQLAYQVSAGAIRQLRPGNTATVRDIILDSANPDSSEIAVNEGNSINLVPVVIDSDQNVRDDFQFSPHARSAVEVSNSRLMRRGYASVYKGLERTRINEARLRQLLVQQAAARGELRVAGYVIQALDHTPYPRRSAPTVADRDCVHGADGVVIGHQYSLLGRVMHEHGAWVGVEDCARISTDRTPVQVGAEQVARLRQMSADRHIFCLIYRHAFNDYSSW